MKTLTYTQFLLAYKFLLHSVLSAPCPILVVGLVISDQCYLSWSTSPAQPPSQPAYCSQNRIILNKISTRAGLGCKVFKESLLFYTIMTLFCLLDRDFSNQCLQPYFGHWDSHTPWKLTL